MVKVSPRYDLQQDTPGNWTVIDHWIDDQYNPDRSAIDEDMPRVQAQLERIYRQNGMLPAVK